MEILVNACCAVAWAAVSVGTCGLHATIIAVASDPTCGPCVRHAARHSEWPGGPSILRYNSSTVQYSACMVLSSSIVYGMPWGTPYPTVPGVLYGTVCPRYILRMILFGIYKICVQVLCGILAQYTCTVCLEPTCTLPAPYLHPIPVLYL